MSYFKDLDLRMRTMGVPLQDIFCRECGKPVTIVDVLTERSVAAICTNGECQLYCEEIVYLVGNTSGCQHRNVKSYLIGSQSIVGGEFLDTTKEIVRCMDCGATFQY